MPTAGSPYGGSPYADSSNAGSPYAGSPYAGSRYAPVPYARPSPPTLASPYAPEPYAPAAYAPATGPYGWNVRPADEPERKPIVTPFRLVIVIALVVSAAIAGYSLLVARGSQTVAITVAALAVFAISAALLGINIGAGAMGSARDGRVGRSIVGAFSGGILCLAAAGGGAAAIMLGMLARP